jgi:hypothetical protein
VGRDSSVGIATRYGLNGPGSNPGECEIYRIRPDRPCGSPSLLYNGTGSHPGVKRLGHGLDQPSPSSAEVEERAELYLYFPSGPSWPVLGWPLPLTSSSLKVLLQMNSEWCARCIVIYWLSHQTVSIVTTMLYVLYSPYLTLFTFMGNEKCPWNFKNLSPSLWLCEMWHRIVW